MKRPYLCFFELAKASNDPESNDLNLAGEPARNWKEQRFVDWIVSQAKVSKDEKQLIWLEYLTI